MDKQSLQWLKRMQKMSGDDATRPSLYRKMAKLTDGGVWGVTNGHYLLLSPTPPGLHHWARGLEAPKTHRYGLDLDQLVIMAQAGELPDPSTVDGLRAQDGFPQVEKVIQMASGRAPMCDLGKLLAEVDGEIQAAGTFHAPTPAQRIKAAQLTVPLKLPPKGIRQPDKMPILTVWPQTGDWTLDVETLEIQESGVYTWNKVTLGHKPNLDCCYKAIGFNLNYLKQGAEGGPWQYGEWSENSVQPALLRWGNEAMVLMPMRIDVKKPAPAPAKAE